MHSAVNCYIHLHHFFVVSFTDNTSLHRYHVTALPMTKSGMRTDNFLCSQHQRLERIDDTCDELFGYHATHDSLDQMTDGEIRTLGNKEIVKLISLVRK